MQNPTQGKALPIDSEMGDIITPAPAPPWHAPGKLEVCLLITF